MGDALEEFIDFMVQAIVALEIEIGRLIGKGKLSQSKEPRDNCSAAEALNSLGEQKVGHAMIAM